MNNWSLILLSFSVGIMVVMQGGINARLGIILNNSMLATTIALVVSASLTVVAALFTVRHFPDTSQLKLVPVYMWFTGGILSFAAVSLFYYIIPRIGISTAVTFGLTAQIIVAAIAGHFGWFGMPVEPMSVKKIIGMGIMVLGVGLIKFR